MKANDQKCISKIPFKHHEPHNKMEFFGIEKTVVGLFCTVDSAMRSGVCSEISAVITDSRHIIVL